MARLAAGVRKRADGTLEKRFTVDGKRYSVYGRNTKEISQKEQGGNPQTLKTILGHNSLAMTMPNLKGMCMDKDKT